MRWERIFRPLRVMALAGTTCNHLRELLQGGWLPYPYHYAPLWLNGPPLTFLDPLALTLARATMRLW